MQNTEKQENSLEALLASEAAAVLATACGIGQRSRALEEIFACLNFRSFYLGMEHTKYTKISTIRKFPPIRQLI
jgi:hypothetical protein